MPLQRTTSAPPVATDRAAVPVLRHVTESISAGLHHSGIGRLLRGLGGRLRGGYLLAFHSAPWQTMVELVDALHPDQVVPLDDLVERVAANRSTAGLFAITVDDGFRDTVIDYCAAARDKGWPMTFYLPTRFLDEHTLPFLVIQNLQAGSPPVVVEIRGRRIDLRTADQRQAYFTDLIHRMYRHREDEYKPEVEAIADAAIAGGFLTPEAIYRVMPPMSWSQVEALSQQDGISFQSHGVSHQAVVCLAADELRRELTTSQAAIRARTGRPVNHFCYPYGAPASIGTLAPAIVSETYTSAVTLSRGRLRGSPLNALPRIPLYDRDRRDIARLKVMTALGPR